jgi:acyl-coenzyme A synthetase/AMP-(fatty) acid ligase
VRERLADALALGGEVHLRGARLGCVGEQVEKDKLLVVAYVIPQPGVDVSPDELAAFGREHLAAYKAPKRIYLAQDFPRTKNGKILRRHVTPAIATGRSNF